MRQVHISADARRDIDDALQYSEERFGVAAELRYRGLIETAVERLRIEPAGLGARPWPGTRSGLYVYHLRHSLRLVPAVARVDSPRHLLVYRFDDERLRLIALLDDSTDLPSRMRVLERLRD